MPFRHCKGNVFNCDACVQDRVDMCNALICPIIIRKYVLGASQIYVSTSFMSINYNKTQISGIFKEKLVSSVWAESPPPLLGATQSPFI